MWNPGLMSDGSAAFTAETPAGAVWSSAPRRVGAAVEARPPLVREALLLVVLFAVYRLGRALIDGHVNEAMLNAHSVLEFERAWFFPNELLVQQWALQWPDAVRGANWYYVGVHFPLTAFFLAWGWWRRAPEDYVWARRLIIMLTAMAFFIHALMPLTPPRLMSEFGFVDTMAVIGPSAYEGSAARIANEFAAMPSLHVGWALLLAVVVVKTSTSRWRWVSVVHPIITSLVVVVTANHYWVDGLVSGALLLLAMKVTPRPARQAESFITISGFPDGFSEPPRGSTVTPTASPGSSPGTKCSTTPSLPRPRTPTDRADPSPCSPITHS